VLALIYAARLEPQAEGGFLVRFRDLPECLTEGADRADALAQAADALGEALASRIVDGEEIPPPSPALGGEALVPAPEPTASKAWLYAAMRAQGLSKAALADSLGVDEKETRRLLDPRHVTRPERLREALAAVGYRLATAVIDAGGGDLRWPGAPEPSRAGTAPTRIVASKIVRAAATGAFMPKKGGGTLRVAVGKGRVAVAKAKVHPSGRGSAVVAMRPAARKKR